MASTNIALLFSKGISNHFFVDIKQVESKYRRIYHHSMLDSRYRDDATWENYPLPQRRAHGTPVKMGAFQQSYTKRYLVDSYGLGDTIPKEDVADDLYGIIHRILPAKGGGLARMFNVLLERQHALYFTLLGWASGTVNTSPDGKSLFNTAHPISANNSGVTWTNRPSTDIDLSVAAYHIARANLVQQLGPNNTEIISNRPRCLVVNPTQHQIAIQITQGQWEPRTADRNMNVIPRDNVDVIEWEYFQSSGTVGGGLSPAAWNSWFIVGETHYLMSLTRAPFDMDSDFDVYTKTHVFTADCRFTYGHTDARGTFGSLGN